MKQATITLFLLVLFAMPTFAQEQISEERSNENIMSTNNDISMTK